MINLLKNKFSPFYVFFVPADSRQVKRVHITEKRALILLGVTFVSVFLLLIHLVGFWHYRSLALSLQGEGVSAQDLRERQELIGKVQLLEKTVKETEQMTGKLAGLVGTEKLSMKKGVGPISFLKFDMGKNTQPLDPDSLNPAVDLLEDKTLSLQSRIHELIKIQEDKLIYVSSTPSIWPVKGWVTSDFGYRRSPFTLARDFHPGLDIAAQWGTPIVSSADGVVTMAGYKGGLGKVVIVDHGFGMTSIYGHTSKLLVKEGDHVKRGMRVALVGSTGHSTGPHLHYEIHMDGVPVDPMKYILQ